MMRYVFRKEFFGGLLYDTSEKDYFYLDKLAARVLLQEEPLTASEFHAFDADADDVADVSAELARLDAVGNTRFLDNQPIPDRLSAPLRIFYEITYRCPEECKHCYTESHDKRDGELSLEEKLRFVQQVADIGCFRLSIAGGEPLADRDFFPVLERALSLGIDVSFSTNGTLVTESVAKRLNQLDVRTINVSIDGWDDESFGIVRGKGRLKFVERGVKTLRRHYHKKIAAKCTLMRTNIRNLDKIIEYAESLGFDVVKFNCVRDSGRAQAEPWLTPTQDEYLQAVQYLAELYNAKRTKAKLVLPVNPYQDMTAIEGSTGTIDELGFGCYAGKESFCVTPVGDITPCSSFGPGVYIDGNIRDRPLLDAWNGGAAMRLFRGMDGGEDCKGCGSYQGCKGGCYLRSLHAYGSIAATDPYCYERKNTKLSPSRMSLPVMR